MLAGEKPRQIPELYELKESENDADDEDLYQSRNTLKPIKLLAELKNDMSSFSRERPYKKKALEGTLVRKHFGGSGTAPTESQLSLKNPVFKFNTLQFRPSAVNNQGPVLPSPARGRHTPRLSLAARRGPVPLHAGV